MGRGRYGGYTGPKPCPGCGKPGSESTRDSADVVCRDCAELLIQGKRYTREMARRALPKKIVLWKIPAYNFSGDLLLRQLVENGDAKVLARVTAQYHGHSIRNKYGELDFDRHFKDRFCALAHSRAIVDHKYDGKHFAECLDTKSTQFYQDNIYLYLEDTIELIRFYRVVIMVTALGEKKGFERGRQILAGIATGENTVVDYNEASLRQISRLNEMLNQKEGKYG